MRIAQVAPLTANVSPDSLSDIERQVFYLTEELVRLGHEVTLFATADSQTQARFRPQSPMAQVGRGWMIFNLLMLEQVFKQEADFDLVHNHVAFSVAPLARRHQTSVLTTIHTPLRVVGEPLYREYNELALVASSESQWRYPFPWLNWQGTIYPGLPGDLYPFQEQPGKYLAFYGRITPEAGLLTAIEIAARAGVEIKIASDPLRFEAAYFQEIRPLFKRLRAEYVGSLSGKQKKEFLQDALALLVPVNWAEPLSLVMIEAMAYGTPVVTSPTGIVPEIVQAGVNGFTFQTLNEAVDCIQKISFVSRRRCREIFEERFTAARMTQEYMAMYEKLAH